MGAQHEDLSTSTPTPTVCPGPCQVALYIALWGPQLSYHPHFVGEDIYRSLHSWEVVVEQDFQGPAQRVTLHGFTPTGISEMRLVL